MENEKMDPVEQADTQPTMVPAKDEGGMGPIIGIIIIIILLALGAMYYFTSGINQIQNENGDGNETLSAQEQAEMLRTQNSSTDLSDIEADLNATDLSGLDDAATEFEAEINSQ